MKETILSAMFIFLSGFALGFAYYLFVKEPKDHYFHAVYDGATGVSDVEMKEDTIVLFLSSEGEVRYKRVDNGHVEVYRVDNRPKPDSFLITKLEINKVGKIEGTSNTYTMSGWSFGPNVIDSFWVKRAIYKDSIFFGGWRLSELKMLTTK